MRLMKNNISIRHPEALFLCSTANEENTEGDIAQMGMKLALEIVTFINEGGTGQNLGKISFIGHSMGGVIIRAALPNLEEYKHLMNSFITLATPHLGYMYNSSKLVDAGI